MEEYVGGYEDSTRQIKNKSALNKRTDTTKIQAESPETIKKPARKNKLTYKQKIELESLPGKIQTQEQKQAQLEQQIAQNGFYQQDKETISSTLKKLEDLQNDLQQAYERWEHLDGYEA